LGKKRKKDKLSISFVKNIFTRISLFGVRDDLDEFLKKKIILTNRLSVILTLFFLIIAAILSTKFYLYGTSVILLLLVFNLILIPVFNKKKHSGFASILLSVILPIYIYIASIYAKLHYEVGKEIVFYFLPRTAILITIIIPLLVLDFRKKFQYYGVLVFYALSILFYSKVHDLLNIGIENAILVGDTYFLASIIPVLILFILISAFILMQKTNYQYEQTLLRKNIELKKSEEKHKAAREKAEESSRLKTEFLRNMSHEIRTPLNGILGFSRLLDNPNVSKEKHETFTRIIENSSNQLLQVIEDILIISQLLTKQVQINKQTFNLNTVFDDLYQMHLEKAKEKNIALHLKKAFENEQCLVFSDQKKINRMLNLLLDNAFKYTNNGFIEFGYKQLNDNLLQLYVKDTGIGIDMEMQEKIFDYFYQESSSINEKLGGLGIGLSIVKELADLLHCTITIKSEKDKGTTFFINLPIKN